MYFSEMKMASVKKIVDMSLLNPIYENQTTVNDVDHFAKKTPMNIKDINNEDTIKPSKDRSVTFSDIIENRITDCCKTMKYEESSNSNYRY